MVMPSSAEKRNRRLLALLIAAGVLVGLFALLFAAANDDWTVVSIPSPPWTPDPSIAAFEARLWAIMLVSFLAGSALAVLAFRSWQIEQHKSALGQRARMRNLETEIKNLNRLLEATMSGQISTSPKQDLENRHGGSDD